MTERERKLLIQLDGTFDELTALIRVEYGDHFKALKAEKLWAPFFEDLKELIINREEIK